MPQTIVTTALVARLVNYGEADRICTLLTREAGKIAALARGARRSRKRYGSALSLFVLVEATLRPPLQGELWQIEDLLGLEDFGSGINKDVIKMAEGSFMLEVTRELLAPGQPEPQILELLTEAFRLLSQSEVHPSLFCGYLLHLLGHLGFSPSLKQCPRCGRKIKEDEDVGFSSVQGGVLCRHCLGAGIALSGAAHRHLLLLQQLNFSKGANQKMPDEQTAAQLQGLLEALLRHQLGRELKSSSFLAQMRGAKIE